MATKNLADSSASTVNVEFIIPHPFSLGRGPDSSALLAAPGGPPNVTSRTTPTSPKRRDGSYSSLMFSCSLFHASDTSARASTRRISTMPTFPAWKKPWIEGQWADIRRECLHGWICHLDSGAQVRGQIAPGVISEHIRCRNNHVFTYNLYHHTCRYVFLLLLPMKPRCRVNHFLIRLYTNSKRGVTTRARETRLLLASTPLRD